MIRQFIQAIYNCFYTKNPQTVMPFVEPRKRDYDFKRWELVYGISPSRIWEKHP